MVKRAINSCTGRNSPYGAVCWLRTDIKGFSRLTPAKRDGVLAGSQGIVRKHTRPRNHIFECALHGRLARNFRARPRR